MRRTLAAALLAVGLAGSALAEVWQLEARAVPFDDASGGVPVTYSALGHAARPWRFCVLYPHLKDAY